MYSLKIENNNAEIYLYSAISGEEITEPGHTSIQSLVHQLNNFTGDKITLRINSEGGDIFEAIGLCNYLRNHKAKVDVYIDGLCASAATIVAMAGDKIYMTENALMMIHNPSGGAFGESEDMRKLADVLDKIAESMAMLYEQRTGLSHKEVLAMMKNETWLNAREAKKLKLVDEVLPALKIKNEIKTYEQGREYERARIRALDDFNTPEREALIYEAKYVTLETVNDIAVNLLKLDARKNDAQRISANVGFSTPQQEENTINAVARMINKVRGYIDGR